MVTLPRGAPPSPASSASSSGGEGAQGAPLTRLAASAQSARSGLQRSTGGPGGGQEARAFIGRSAPSRCTSFQILFLKSSRYRVHFAFAQCYAGYPLHPLAARRLVRGAVFLKTVRPHARRVARKGVARRPARPARSQCRLLSRCSPRPQITPWPAGRGQVRPGAPITRGPQRAQLGFLVAGGSGRRSTRRKDHSLEPSRMT